MEPHFGLKSQEEVRLWMTPLNVTQQPCLLCASAFLYAKWDEIVQLRVELLWWTVSLIFKGDLFIFLMNYVCMCVSMWVYAITNMCTLGVWKRMVDLLQLELKVVVSHLIECWEFNLGPLYEQWELLTTEPSLQTLKLEFESHGHLAGMQILVQWLPGVGADILYYKPTLGHCGVAVTTFELGSGSHTLWGSSGTSDGNEWTFWWWPLFSLESPSVSSKGIIHVGKSNLSSLLCPVREACCGPLWRESLFLSHLPTPTAYDKAP